MAQTGYTPILIYASGTTGNTPSAANLTSSASGAELALNYFDGKLFYKDAAGVVQVLAGKGGTGVVAGSNTQIQFNNNGVFGAAAGLTWDGTYLTANSIKDSALTSGRITFAGAAGLLQDSANLTFDGTTLTAANITSSGTWTISGGTANGVAYLNASKVLTTGSALTFDGTVLLSGAGGTGTSSSILKLSGSNATNYGSYLQFLRNSVPTWSIGNDSAINGGTSDDLTIYGTASQRFYASSTEQMRLTSTGLGIGTSSPLGKLDVASAGNTVSVLRATSSGSPMFYLAGAGAGSPSIAFNSSQILRFAKSDDAAFTNYTELMQLNASGNLGLGVTPQTWWGSRKALQINTGGAFVGSNAGFIEMYGNAYLNGSAQNIYLANGAAALYQMGSGSHAWFTAPSGTAGNAITFTQAMTLDASGKLFVGTTSGATKIDVRGTSASADATIQIVGNTVSSLLLGQNADGGVIRGQGGNNALSFWTGGSGDTGAASSGTERARIDSSGNLQVSNLAGTGNRAVYSTSTGILTNSSSDRTLKTDDQPIAQGLEAVEAMRPVNFKWVDEERFGTQREIGFIAQEMQELVPEVVGTNHDGTLSIDYPKLTAVLVKAVQELSAKVASLEAK